MVQLVVQLHQSRIFGARSTAATGRWLHLKRRTRRRTRLVVILAGIWAVSAVRDVLARDVCCRCCRPQIGLSGGLEDVISVTGVELWKGQKSGQNGVWSQKPVI